MSNFFIDESIFDGILEFNTPTARIRAENRGLAIFVYIFNDLTNSFLFTTRVMCEFEPEKIYKAYIENAR